MGVKFGGYNFEPPGTRDLRYLWKCMVSKETLPDSDPNIAGDGRVPLRSITVNLFLVDQWLDTV